MSKKRKITDMEFLMYYNDWYEYLYLLCLNRYEWTGLPNNIDPYFIERTLMEKGKGLFFNGQTALEQDDVFYAFTKVNTFAPFDLYGYPTKRHAFALNGFHYDYTHNNSVLIYNNRAALPDLGLINKYAYNLANIEFNLQANIKQQKFPVIVVADPEDEITMKKLTDSYSGGEPFLFTRKNIDIQNALNVLQLEIPFLADKMHTELHMTLNDAYNRLGIESSNTDKNERLITQEVSSNMGSTESVRYIGLNTRRYACQLIKSLYGLEIGVNYQTNIATIQTPQEIDYEKLGREGELDE
jgi:hypothetical protein